MNKDFEEYIDSKLKEYFNSYDWGLPDDIDPHDCLMSVSELERASFRDQFDFDEFMDHHMKDFKDFIQERLEFGNY